MDTISQPRIWVLDATFLWGMSSVDLLGRVLAISAGRLRVTPAVIGDLEGRVGERRFLKSALDAIRRNEIETVSLSRQEQRTTFSLHSSLWQNSPRSKRDLGESETIAVAGHRGWNAVIDEKKAKIVLPLRFKNCECYTTPQVMLALVEAGQLTMDLAYDYLQTMSAKPNFRHEFAGVSKARWMDCRSMYGTSRF